jgi:hypothetical protein
MRYDKAQNLRECFSKSIFSIFWWKAEDIILERQTGFRNPSTKDIGFNR